EEDRAVLNRLRETVRRARDDKAAARRKKRRRVLLGAIITGCLILVVSWRFWHGQDNPAPVDKPDTLPSLPPSDILKMRNDALVQLDSLREKYESPPGEDIGSIASAELTAQLTQQADIILRLAQEGLSCGEMIEGVSWAACGYLLAADLEHD